MSKLTTLELSAIYRFVDTEIDNNKFIELEHAYKWARKVFLKKRKINEKYRNKKGNN